MKKIRKHANPDDVLLELIKQNKDAVGNYFIKLWEQNLSQNEKMFLALLVRSTAYRKNNLTKLLELIADIKEANLAKINFYEKYMGELFLPSVDKLEQQENRFLDKKVVPFLTNHLNNTS